MLNPKIPLILLILWLPLSLLATENELLDYPREAFEAHFAKELVTYEAVQPGIDFFKDSTADGLVLLNEYRRYTTEDNVRYSLEHRIYYSKDESGAESNGRETFSYRKSNQKIYLVLGRSIQPDGTIAEVQENAVFTQASQKDADSELFSDFEDMVVIFPDVKPGSITEFIVLRVTHDPIAPDEITTRNSFQSGWPTYLRIDSLDLPEAFGKRMRFFPLGKGVPEPEVSVEDGRYRWNFTREKVDKYQYEPRRMSLYETGPAVFGTTFASWDDVATWSRELFKERNTLDQALMDTVDAWTREAESDEEIIRIIARHIADDVRYTGLEFGIAGYQPYDCNTVWENKYGDCKDKANLLAACLRYKGIDAYVALLDTDGFGSFPEECPSPFYFNHAITAIRQGDGFLFFDPTVEKLDVGDLPGGDLNRKALVVLEDRGELVSTPLYDLGTIHWNFDLELSAAAELSGWAQLHGKRYYRSWYHALFEKYSQEDLRWEAHDFITGFYPAAETSDAVLHLEESGQALMEAYFTLGAASQQSNGKVSVKLPNIAWMLPNVGDTPERVTDYSIYPGTKEISLQISLPEGWDAPNLPDAVKISNPYIDFKADWIITGNTLKAGMRIAYDKNRLPADEFATLYEHTKALQRWLETPIIIEPLETEIAETSDRSLEALPRLKTAKGQLALIRQWYPDETKFKKPRRQALEKLIEWFPSDERMLYEAHMEIVRIDMDGDSPEAVLEYIDQTIEQYGHAVTAKFYAWGQYLKAMQLENLERPEEAVEIYIDLAEDENLQAYRRGWSCNQAADILRKQGDERLIDLVETCLTFESEAQVPIGANLVLFYLEQGRLDDALDFLKRKQDFFGDEFQRLLNMVDNTLESEDLEYEEPIPETWYQCLEGLQLEDAPFKNLLAEAKGRFISEQSHKHITRNTQRLAKWLSRKAPDWYTFKEGLPAGMTESDLISEIEADEENSEWSQQLNHLLLYISHFDEHPDLYFRYYYWALYDIYHYQYDEALARTLGNALKDYSPLISNVAEAYTTWVDLQIDFMGNNKDALSWCNRMLEEDGLAPKYEGMIGIRKALVLKFSGNTREAIDLYLQVLPFHELSWEVYHGLWIGWFTAKNFGDDQAAEQFQNALMKATEKDLTKLKAEYPIKKLQEYKGQESKLKEYAALAPEWQQAWDSLARKFGYYDKIDQTDLQLFLKPGEIRSSIAKATKDGTPEAQASEDAFFKLYSLAREAQWLPSLCLNLASEFQAVPDSYAYHREMQKLILNRLKTCGDYLPDGQEYAAVETLADTYFAGNQIMNGQILLRESLEQADIPREWEEKLTLMWARSVIQSGLGTDKPIYLLYGWLDQRPMKDIRAEAVDLIVTQWQADGDKEDDILQLLNQEIKNRAVQSDVERLKKFSQILQKHDKETQSIADYANAVKKWRKDQHFAWWDNVLPRGLDDPRINDPETITYQDNLENLERAKAIMLNVERGDNTLQALVSDFNDIILGMKSFSLFPDEIYEYLDNINDYPPLANQNGNLTRIAKLIFALYMKDEPTATKTLGTGSYINDSWLPTFKAMVTYLQTNPKTPEEKFEALSKVCKEPIFQEAYDFIMFRTNELVIEGRSDLARQLLDELKSAPIHPSLDQSTFQLRIRLGKQIQFMEKVQPFYQMVNDIFTPLASSAYSPTLQDCYNLVDGYFSLEQLPAVACYFSSGADGNEENLWNLKNSFTYFSLQPTDDQLKVIDQIDATLESQTDPLVKNLICYCLYHFDQDDPAIQERILEMSEKYSEREDYEEFCEAFYFLKIGYFIKRGDKEKIEKLEIPESLSDYIDLNVALSMHAYIEHDDRDLARYMDKISPSFYEKESFYTTIYAFSRVQGDDLTAQMVAEALPDYTNEQLVDIVDEGQFPTYYLLDLYALGLLDKQQVIPLTELHIKRCKAEWEKPFVESFRDLLEEDWESCKKNVSKTIETVPNNFIGQFVLGLSEYRLGNYDNALNALGTFQKSSNEAILLRYTDDLINKIKTAQKPNSQ